MVPYLQDSRNLLIVNNSDKRKRLLRRGKNNIVAFLTTLPRTQHDPSTLTVDCSIFTVSENNIHFYFILKSSKHVYIMYINVFY